MKPIIFYVLFIIYMPQALAHSEAASNQDYRVLKEIDLGQQQKAYVIVREDGHLLGQPYQVELRVACGKETGEPNQLPIKDSFSVCDLKPESLKINRQQTAVAMKTKMADINAYYENLQKPVKCLKATEVKKFSLRDLCKS